MDRPVTSKSRGICRYYNTSRGCFAGDSCKFLHGPDEQLTPYDKGKVCRYFVKGHCTRGDACWFRHEHPKSPPGDQRTQVDAEPCCICMEKPVTYGLLTDCSHVFCLQCIRQWRNKDGKSLDMVSTGAIKCCPLCRRPSRFITPSTHFFPSEHPQKTVIVNAYKASMARVSCKYFEETSRAGKPCCPFGSDCFYNHTNPDGTSHVFRHGARQAMKYYRRSQRNNGNRRASSVMHDGIPIQFFFGAPRTYSPLNFDETAYDESDDDIDDDFYSEELFDALIDNLVMQRMMAEADETPQTSDDDDGQRSPDSPAPLPTSGTPDTRDMAPPNADASDESVDPVGPVPTSGSSPPGSTPARNTPSPRLSITATIDNRGALIMNVSDEDSNEAVSPSDSYEDETADTRAIQDSAPVPPSSPVPGVDTCHAADGDAHDASVVGGGTEDTRGDRADPDHPSEPPFVTDGRGRVVWSSPCNGRVEGGREAQWARSGPTKSTNAARTS